MAALVSKKREGEAWRVYIKGRKTDFVISKGERPRYRAPQTYWIDRHGAEDEYPWPLAELKGVREAMDLIAAIAEAAQ